MEAVPEAALLPSLRHYSGVADSRQRLLLRARVGGVTALRLLVELRDRLGGDAAQVVAAVDGAAADREAEVVELDARVALEVGAGEGHLADAVVGAGGEAEP